VSDFEKTPPDVRDLLGKRIGYGKEQMFVQHFVGQ
jgi:hypothetical protein